ncbi:MAG: DUF3848 domain-containing protein [Clostridia bacterium]|nr:DUF3848 domain-containing protein [Clostridia bacterium]
MSTENLRDILYEKAAKEQSDYIQHLKTLPPEQIISRAYEKVMRDDILMTFEDDYLSDKQVAELLKLDYPLSACYDEWMDTDYSHMEMLRDTVYDYTQRLVNENAHHKEKNDKNHDMER